MKRGGGWFRNFGRQISPQGSKKITPTLYSNQSQLTVFLTQVIKHEDGNVDCPCQDSIKHLSLFKNTQKRTNSESSSCSAKKLCQNSPMANSLSPPSDFSPTSNLDGNISPYNNIQNGGE